MNFKIAFVKDMFDNKELFLKDGKLIYRDPATKVETVIAVDSDQSDALPKEIAIKHGFLPELNEHGARRSSYVDARLNELRASNDPNERRAVDFLPQWFVFEDELNDPAPGTAERATLNKNDSHGFTSAILGNPVSPWQDKEGAVVKGHFYIYLGDSHDKAVKQLADFNEWFDKKVPQIISLVSNNSRI